MISASPKSNQIRTQKAAVMLKAHQSKKE